MTTHHLPPQSTPFVGRQPELAEIRNLFANPDCRLLTLVGPGGIGKTRLALEAARTMPDSPLPEGEGPGVYFVPLQPLTSADFIVPAIADAIHFQFYPGGDPKQQLLDYFREKSLLLLLDNFEHLLEGAGIVAEILAYAPGIKVLTTSRERFNLREEWVLNVEGLPFPASETEIAIDDYSAVQLFLQHAQRVQVGFSLTQTQKPAVARICRMVGGMPLGVELAAAWVRALSCEQIASELERSLDILETPARNIEPRHRTMRAVFDPTWERLADDEREVFRRLSVFRGGFTREAAEHVAGASLRLLSSLADKSLLRVDANGRYEIHELLRQYGEEQLEVSAEAETIRDAHLSYYTAFMKQREASLKDHRQKTALGEIQADIDNVRAAWDWALAHERGEIFEEASECLRYFYQVRGRFQEGAIIFQKALDSLKLASDKLSFPLGKALLGYGSCCCWLSLNEQAIEVLQQSLVIFAEYDARWETALALAFMGLAASRRDRLKQAQYYEESLALSREIGADWLTAYTRTFTSYEDPFVTSFEQQRRTHKEKLALAEQIGDPWLWMWEFFGYGTFLVDMGEYAEAKVLLAEALAVSQACNFQIATAFCVNIIGLLAVNVGDFEESRRCYQESYALARDAGSRHFTAYALQGMSRAALMQGEYVEARRLAQESLTIFLQSENQVGIIYAYLYLGVAVCRLQQYEEARQHFGNALRIAAKVEAITVLLYVLAWMAELLVIEDPYGQTPAVLALTLHHSLSWMETQDQARRVLAQLEPELPLAVVVGIRAGWNVDDFYIDELAAALELTAENIHNLLAGLKPPEKASHGSAHPQPGTLNERELEILGLMAEGLTNREIAEQLIFSVNTVKWYVKEIFSKLHVSNRTQAVTQARALGLLT